MINILAVYGLSITHVFAQTPDLERRVGTIEKKLDALIELMQSRKGQPTPARPAVGQVAGATSQSDDGAVPEGYEPGMYLDVYATGITLNDNNVDQAIPDTYPSGSVKIQPMNTFPYGELLKHQELKDFANMGNSLAAVKYSGQLVIENPGQHTFQLKLNIESRNKYYCISSFYLNDSRLIHLKNDRYSMSNQQSAIKLYAGIYNYAVFILCVNSPDYPRASDIPFDKIRADVLMAGPNDRAPKPIPVSNFVVKYQ